MLLYIGRHFPVSNLDRCWLAVTVSLLIVQATNAEEPRPASEVFFVIDRGTALLGPDGKEIERLSSKTYAAGSLSPNKQWISFTESKDAQSEKTRETKLFIQSRLRPEDRTTVPLVWGGSGTSFLPIWSPDSQRILICEQGGNSQVRASDYRIYDLAKDEITEFELPNEWWPSDWSADGKRLLASLDGRIAWVNIDGKGEPEFITPKQDVAYGARLSPDGRRILCMAGFRRAGEERHRLRLSVYDLETKRRMFVDEPGETDGYCWSPDGSSIAYTWQRSLDKPAKAAVRETYLITCDFDGTQRKTVTTRKYEVPENSSGRDDIIFFFHVLAWR